LRGWAIKTGGAVEAIKLDENGAGFGRAAAAQNRRDPLDRATSEMRGDPEI
jgi:hypothetical protein